VNLPIQCLWIGSKIGPMGELCLRSYLAHGHGVDLYAYEPLSNLPRGVVRKDANEVLSRTEFDYRSFPHVAAFSDYFRYKLLLERGGWWVDMDTVCLKPFIFDSEYVFASENRYGRDGVLVASAYIKAPAGAPIIKYCWETCKQRSPQSITWGSVGPVLLTEAVSRFALQSMVRSTQTFCPVNWWEARRFTDVQGPELPKESYAVHLWNEMWQKNSLNPEESRTSTLYGKLRQRYTPKALIAILTCKSYKARMDLLERTWLPLARARGLDMQVFDGQRLGVPDDYANFYLKVKAVCRYALANGYDYLLKLDDDTYLCPERFGVIEEDYAGIRIPANDGGSSRLGVSAKPSGTYPLDYASGGAYWLSRKAMQIIADALWGNDWAEDRWIGHVLQAQGIPFTELPDYALVWPHPFEHYLAKDCTVLTQITSPDNLLKCHERAQGVAV
jgi:hypothetical protein